MKVLLRNSPFVRAFSLSLPFVLAYFLIRSIPVTPCDFLHEESYNLEGELDYCGPGDSNFVDLSVRKWPMGIDFKPIDEPTAGKPCRFEINIRQFDGSPLGPDDVALSHTRKIHLLAINESLGDYQHIHPEADELFDGTWRFAMTPKVGGDYKVFLDFIPLRSPRRVLLGASFRVSGQSPGNSSIGNSLTKTVGEDTFSLKPVSPIEAGSEISLELAGVDQNGNPIQLVPVMGAFAHMVAFDSSLKGFAHLHPNEDSLPRSTEDVHKGALVFRFLPPQDGVFRLWAQVRRKNSPVETFIPFDLVVES